MTQPLGPLVDPTPCPRPSRIRLEGRYCSLVPLDPARHTEPLWHRLNHASLDHLWTYLLDGPYPDFDSFAAAVSRQAASPDPLYFAIEVEGVAVGRCAFMRIDPAHKSIEVGSILYTPELQRTRAATEAMYLMARHAFEDLGYRRYEWKCHSFNEPSKRAARRLGFTHEGTFRQHFIIKGRSRDTDWFSMIDSEWPDRKQRFERWLDPANFDAAGQQLTTLDSLA